MYNFDEKVICVLLFERELYMSIWQRIKEIPLIRIFSITILISFCIWIAMLFTGNGNPMFFGVNAPCDNLFDDYKCLTSAVYNLLPYETLFPWSKGGYSYPPNGYLFYAFWGNVINRINPTDISSSQLLFASLYLTFCSFSLFILIFNFTKNITKFDRYLFCMAILASGAYLFAYERTNMIFITLLFLTFFIFYYNSKNKILKELALVSLAAAVSFKMSPAIFGMFLLWNKDYKAIFRLIFYTIILFIVPSLFYPGGLDILKTFVENLELQSSFIVDTCRVSGIGKSFINKFMIANFGGNMETANELSTFWISLISLLSLFTTFFFKEKWKKAFLLSFMMVVIPALSYGYVLIYFIPVMVLYFMEEKHSKTDLLFLLWFIIIFWTGTLQQTGAKVYYSVQEFGLWAAFLQIFIYGIIMTIKNFKQIFIQDFIGKKAALIKAIKNSKKQTEYVKFQSKQILKLTGLSALILILGIYMYGINYTFFEKSFKKIDAPITIHGSKIKIKDDFRLSVNTTFITKQTIKPQVLFQTSNDGNGITLVQNPDMTLSLEYPIQNNATETYTFRQTLKNGALYNFTAEITAVSISPLLSEYKFAQRKWKAFMEKPYLQKIDRNAISEITIGGTKTVPYSGQMIDFYLLLKNGNNTNALVIITLLGTFFPLFLIAYNRKDRKFIKQSDKK